MRLQECGAILEYRWTPTISLACQVLGMVSLSRNAVFHQETAQEKVGLLKLGTTELAVQRAQHFLWCCNAFCWGQASRSAKKAEVRRLTITT
jgi:hypothetical protein